MSQKQPSESFTCPICYKSFGRKDSMERHKNSVHLKLKQVCSVCDEEFSNKDSLNRHTKSVHEERKKFKCLDCPLTFSRRDNCFRHVQSARANWRRHGVAKVCDACGEKYVAPTYNAAKTKSCHECKKDGSSDCKK